MDALRASGSGFPSYARLGALTIALGVVACGSDYSAFRVFKEVGGYQAATGAGASETAVRGGGGGAEGANGGAGGGAGANGTGGAGTSGGTGAGATGGRMASAGGTGSGGLPPGTGGAYSGGSPGMGGSSSGGCAGVLDSGICWYYGAPGESCATTCATHGGPSPQAPSHVGISSQGGSLSECTRLLGLLGMTGTVTSGTRSDGQGLGCHVFTGPTYWWLSSPAYSDTAQLANVRVVCGCVQ